MRILFVVSELGYVDPLGVAYLSAVARRAGHDCFFYCLEENNNERAASLRPDVVAYSAYSSAAEKIAAFHQWLRSRREFISIIGGPHPTFSPREALEAGFDACCVGEGELAFSEFLQRVSGGRSLDGIDGLLMPGRTDYTIRPLVSDLDELPFPDRDLVLGNTILGKVSKKTFITGRGCPFLCTYCLNRSLQELYRGKGRFVRRHSVDRVLEEIGRVRSRYRTDFIRFGDDIFCLKADNWLQEFSRRYPREVGIPFNCNVRLDLLTDEIVKLLKSAGCHSVSASIDSASARARKEVLDREMSDELIIRSLRLLEAHGIKSFVNFILELPGTTAKDDMASIALARAGGADYVQYTFLVPFPGTRIWKYCLDHGYIEPGYTVPRSLFAGPSLNSQSRDSRVRRNIYALGQLAQASPTPLRWLLLKIIRFSPHLKFFGTIKRKVHLHYMQKVIYQCRDDVRIRLDL